jgi:hypothetical protein
VNPSDSDVLLAIKSGALAKVLRGEQCVFSTPANINDDMRPTDHDELLENGLYILGRAHGVSYIQSELERALLDICSDALGVFCAHQCFYVEMVKEREGCSPFSLNKESLPKYLAASFLRETPALHSLEIRNGDLVTDRSYRVTLSGMRILERDYGIDWGQALPMQ